jgi:hypothetical protein
MAALLSAVLALLVAGCGGDDEPTAKDSGATASTQDADATPEADAAEEERDGDSEAEREREEQEAEAAGGKDCADAGDLDGDPEKAPPPTLAVPADAHLYESEGPFGKTERFFAVLDGTPEDLPKARDEASTALTDKGFESLSTDEEEGAEAEAHLKGKDSTIDIQVAPLCEGKIRIRYTVS